MPRPDMPRQEVGDIKRSQRFCARVLPSESINHYVIEKTNRPVISPDTLSFRASSETHPIEPDATAAYQHLSSGPKHGHYS